MKKNCPLYLTRVRKEIGVSIWDLDLLTIGMVLDIWTEKGNDYENNITFGSIYDHDYC